MPVQRVIPKIESNNNKSAIKVNNLPPRVAHAGADSVSFTGLYKAPNVIVGLMDFIAAGGYAASFIIQDGLGFIAPRVGKGLLRGGKEKKDRDGNVVLDKNGNPKHELNWEYARKEGIREVVTGPSTFLIPLVLLKGVTKKFGTANNVRLDYIDAFKNIYSKYAKENLESIKNGSAEAEAFYEEVYKDVLNRSINSNPNADKLSEEEVSKIAKDYANKQIKLEKILSDKSLTKKQRKNMLKELGSSIEDDFMDLKKGRIGGIVNDMAIEISASNGKDVKSGSISELTKAMKNYYHDVTASTKNALEKDSSATVEDVLKGFTKTKLGSRILTNLGMFGAVAAFYTQIPKLYNLGLKSNPALEKEGSCNKPIAEVKNEKGKKEIQFTGGMKGILGGLGDRVFNNKTLKKVSDIFELNGPIIEGSAMSVLLYGFCIPPRLKHAQDKYDFGEIVLRDLTAFTIFLFGAKALSRLFSDGFTKLTGLGLNKKNLEGRKWYQKVIDYMNPVDKRHSVLSSRQLESKYTYIDKYKNGVNGFFEFIEGSGGDIKKALGQDKKVKAAVSEILGKDFAQATSEEIKSVLNKAHVDNTEAMQKFYKLFKGPNGLLNRAKTCNSAFGFLSTIILVPLIVMGLTDMCEKLTKNRQAKEKEDNPMTEVQAQRAPLVPSSKPTMEGFLRS